MVTVSGDTGIEFISNLSNKCDILTNNEISYPPSNETKPTPKPKVCTRLGKCKYCPLISKLGQIACRYTTNTYNPINLPKYITCEIDNIIYVITCIKCNKLYIGETGRQFRKKVYEHRLTVMKAKEKRTTHVSRHFATDNRAHNHMRFSVLE